MSTTSVESRPFRAVHFWRSTNGKKAVMAVTGAVMFLFIIGHLLGNLLIFDGQARINAYAQFLHFDSVLLWIVRSALLVVLALHLIATIQLAIRNKKARPIPYTRWKPINSTYASRTMYWSGPIILAFIIFHVLQFAAGYIHPEACYTPGDVYHNLISGFQVWWVSVSYVLAISLLGLHLRHGLWSMLQSVGLAHSLHREKVFKQAALLIAVLIVLGYISIPISILAGFLK